MEKPCLSIARYEELYPSGWRHRPGSEPFIMESSSPSRDRENDPPPACPAYVWDQQFPGVFPEIRPVFEENSPEPVARETLFRRPCPANEVLPEGKIKLFSLPFPQKLWKIVNSSKFASICWDDGGIYVGINAKLFQKEILGRSGANKVFETDCMKSFIRQLNLYGFSKMRQDAHTSLFLSSFYKVERPVYGVSKLQFYYNPYFKRDSPHLLKRIKRRVGIKSILRYVRSKPEGQESSVGSRATVQEEDRAPEEEENQELPEQHESPPASPYIEVVSLSPVTPESMCEPTGVKSDPTAVTQLAQGQPEGGQEPLSVMADTTVPAQPPFMGLPVPPPQLAYGPEAGPPPPLPPGGVFQGHPPYLPYPVILPCCCHPWVPIPLAAPGHIVSVPLIPHPSPMLHCCPRCHYVSEYVPATSGPFVYPHCAYYPW